MRRTEEQQLRRALKAVGLTKGDLLMVHSSLFRLGPIKGVTIAEIPSLIHRALVDQIGPDGTIVVPTFNFDFCRGVQFDRNHTPSQSMGAYSEYVRRLPQARRSPHPIQSVAAVGRLAREVTRRDTPGAFEPGGSFDFLVEKNARLLLLGCGINAVSLVHWAEEKVGVPYRYWKDFSGAYRDGRWSDHRTYRMYVRDLTLDPEVRLDRIGQLLERRDQLRRVHLGGSTIEACMARPFTTAAVELLRRDPTALIRENTDSDSGGLDAV